MKLPGSNASFNIPKQNSTVHLIRAGIHANGAADGMSPSPAWSWLRFWQQAPSPSRRARSFSFPLMLDTAEEGGGAGTGAGQGENEQQKEGGRKQKHEEGIQRVWRMARVILALFCVCVLTVQGLVHWAMSSGVDQDVRGYQMVRAHTGVGPGVWLRLLQKLEWG
jgi:hypothetical protein